MIAKKVEVLLIEDNPADALLIKHTIYAIQGLSVQVHTASTLAEAFAFLEKQSTDLILLDLMLPDSQVGQTFSTLAAVHHEVPVVVLSGIDNQELALSAIKEGAQDYLVKGEIDAKLLERTIRYAIERAKLLNAQKKIQQDIQAQDALLKLITNISADFINLSSEQIDNAIIRSLHSIGTFLQVDKVFVFELNETDDTIHAHYQWPESNESIDYILSTIPRREYIWLMKKLHAEGVIRFYDTTQLPAHIDNLRQVLQSQNIHSFMITGLFYQNKVRAILGLATVGKTGQWNTETVSLLNTSGEVFYRAIKKKQTEERLKESERRYRSLVENIDEGLIYVDLNERIQFANQSMCSMLGYTYEEIIGKNFLHDLFHTEGLTSGGLNLFSGKRDLLLKSQYEIPIRKKNGEKVWVIIHNHPITNNQGKKIGAMGTLVNITERKGTEEKLKNANEELKTFIYRTSHDLRGPLASVLGITNLANMEITDIRALQYFAYINKSTQKLDKTLKSLIDVASITQPDEKYEAVDFRELIIEVIDNMNYTNGLENLSIRLDIQQTNNFISNKQGISHIFEKLIENAVSYRKLEISNPGLLIKVVADQEEARIELEDNGIGIPKELHHKIFTMFFKGGERSRGSGLGLYIVDKLVSSLNGKITIDSQVNVGSKFSFTLKSL
jgi:PAS domain S-box-containing protein